MTSDRATTIATIAEDVGLSVATVSKVLNGRSDVAAATRARVQASLDRHGYRPRARRRSTKPQLDLVFHELDSGWAMEIIRGVEAVTATAAIDIHLSQLDGRHSPPAEWLDGVLGARPVGVLLVLCHPTETQQRQLQRQRIPLVVLDTDSATTAAVPTVGSNNFNGGMLAAQHLLKLGHQRTAVISGPREVLCSRARVAGFQAAHEEAGIRVDARQVRYGNFHVNSGDRYGTELLRHRDRPTAIFAGSDLQAVGVLRAARRLGLDVPGDVSIVGYDNLPIAEWVNPTLTTINQPLRDMAGAATRMLLDLAGGAELPTSRIDLVTELIVRESTAHR